MSRHLRILLVSICISATTWLNAQELLIQNEDDSSWTYRVRSYEEAERALRSWKNEQISRGYLSVHTDSVMRDEGDFYAAVLLGNRYYWSGLVIEDSLGVWTSGLPESRKDRKRLLIGEELELAREKVLQRLEENGYPFASCGFRDLRWDGDTLYCSLAIEKGPFIRFDSLIVRSDARINPAFLRRYLEIRTNDPYNEKLIRRIPSRINEIPYLKSSRSPEVLFAGNGAEVYLYLEEQKASFANGVIGLQPDAETGEITITGQLELKLLNGFKRGELLHLNWRKLQAQTQDILAEIQYPYLIGTPLGAEGMLKIYRRDTTFSTVNGRAGLNYMLSGGNTVRVFLESVRHNRLSGLSVFPGLVGNVKVNSYGAGLEYRNLDYRFNPRSGYAVLIHGKVGNKELTDSVDTDTGVLLPRKSIQYQAEIELQYFQPLASRFTLMFRLMGGWIENEVVLENEMFRLGGLNNLRGFDEESILASRMAIGTAELRYILGKNARFFVFHDRAWYRREGEDVQLEDRPYGFGTGISFETKAGIFSLSYALGKAFENPILLRGAKVHFGFTSLF